MTTPMQLLFLRKISPQISEPCNDPIIMVIVHRHRPQRCASENAILYRILSGFLIIFIEHLFTKVHGRQIVRRAPVRPKIICEQIRIRSI